MITANRIKAFVPQEGIISTGDNRYFFLAEIFKRGGGIYHEVDKTILEDFPPESVTSNFIVRPYDLVDKRLERQIKLDAEVADVFVKLTIADIHVICKDYRERLKTCGQHGNFFWASNQEKLFQIAAYVTDKGIVLKKYEYNPYVLWCPGRRIFFRHNKFAPAN